MFDNFDDFFCEATGYQPFPYQKRLSEGPLPHYLAIPTGLGKTAAAVIAWLWRRGGHGRGQDGECEYPRRLVYCLPMRVLVEQTHRNVVAWLQALELLGQPGQGKVSVHMLMGGEGSVRNSRWADYPEEDAIIIGTQDMLLSRALMRGYGMSSYLWPVHFALLHNDALWVIDEVQLMGTGLATTAQLEGFRKGMAVGKPSHTLWMSATLNSDWLNTVDLRPFAKSMKWLSLDHSEKELPTVRARREATKRLKAAQVRLDDENCKSGAKGYALALAEEVASKHVPGRTTLVVLNTIERAQALFKALQKKVPDHSVQLLLIHSRFRGPERKSIERMLTDEPSEAGRIVVSTQAIEAGVDMTSGVLFTELAPWSSLVQRFGRCNRYGELNDDGGADVYWIDMDGEQKQYLPYQAEELERAKEIVVRLSSAQPAVLPRAEGMVASGMVLRRKDFVELFNTEPDLTGFHTDVSPFIRDTEETEVQVFWRLLDRVKEGKLDLDDEPKPECRELCRASLGQFNALLKSLKKGGGKAYVWDNLTSKWIALGERIHPGLVVMLDTRTGGYHSQLGFSPDSKSEVDSLAAPTAHSGPPEGYNADPLAHQGRAITLGSHLANVQRVVLQLCEALELGEAESQALVEAANWHDVGKAHPAFQNMLLHSMNGSQSQTEQLWAKSDRIGVGKPSYFTMEDGKKCLRVHFRHELASALAWLSCNESQPQRDLVAYLVAAHHGKVRMGLRSQLNEKEPAAPNRLFARGVWDDDVLPAVVTDEGQEVAPQVRLKLDIIRIGEGPGGPSWITRTQQLLEQFGPFRLAFLESLVRIADWRASRMEREQ